MRKSGIVTEIKKHYVCLLTSSGEFVKIKYKGAAPAAGEIYSGDLYSAPKLKMPLIAASLAFVLFSGALYSYVTPAYAVTLEINPSLKLHVNIWNRIVKAEAINEDGNKLLTELNVNNMNIAGGLEAIVEEAKKSNYIAPDSMGDSKVVKVTLEGKASSPESIKHFTDTLKEENINLEVTKNGTILESSTVSHKSNNSNRENTPSTNNSKNKSEKAVNNSEPKKDKNETTVNEKENKNIDKEKKESKDKEVKKETLNSKDEDKEEKKQNKDKDKDSKLDKTSTKKNSKDKSENKKIKVIQDNKKK